MALAAVVGKSDSKMQGVFVNEPNRIEMMLFKEKLEKNDLDWKFVECPTKEWIALWDEYSKEDKKERSKWRLENKFITSVKKGEQVLKNLNTLKKVNPELFQKCFDKEFILTFMCEFIKSYVIELDPKSEQPLKKKLISFVKKNLQEAIDETDMWEKIKQELYEPRGVMQFWEMPEIVCFITLWKTCLKKEVHVDLTKRIYLKKVICNCWPMMDESWQEQSFFKERFMRLLQAIDGFRGCEKYFLEEADKGHLEEFVKFADQELMYEALMKNFINLRLVNKTIELAAKKEKLDLIPLLILKKNGEWPEDELFDEKD